MLKDDEFWGIVVYEILEDGCLNGIWTNTANNGVISNEIAKKIKDKENNNSLIGTYQVSWIEPSNESNQCILSINNIDSLYTLNWGDEYKGKGFKMNNKLIVTYWETK